MRQMFVECKYRYQAFNVCPWASFIIKVSDGYHCFESYDDYITFCRQK